MPKYLIEIPHENSKAACDTAVHAFMTTGSHFCTNAEWGCHDNEHKAWILADLDSKQQALSILPPAFRRDAKVIEVERLSGEALRSVAQEHE